MANGDRLRFNSEISKLVETRNPFSGVYVISLSGVGIDDVDSLTRDITSVTWRRVVFGNLRDIKVESFGKDV